MSLWTNATVGRFKPMESCRVPMPTKGMVGAFQTKMAVALSCIENSNQIKSMVIYDNDVYVMTDKAIGKILKNN